MDKEELKVRIEALERLNSTLLRINKENANKARKRPRKSSGYVFKGAEERWERILTHDTLRGDIRYSNPIRCWKLIFETPYVLEMEPENVKTAVYCDLNRFGFLPLEEPIDSCILPEGLQENPIFRIFLKCQAEGYWEIVIYSICFISFSEQNRKAIRKGLQTDSEDCISENESENNYEVSIIEDPNGGFVAYYSDLPGCITSGETLEEVMKNAEDAKKAWFEVFEKDKN